MNISMNELCNVADIFISERNWWQFHNPKSEAMNIMVEIGELAEQCIHEEHILQAKNALAEEMADVLFGCLCFSLQTKIDIAHALGTMVGKEVANEGDVTFEEIYALVMQNLDAFNLQDLTKPQQVILSLMAQANQLADLFVWSTDEQSKIRAEEKKAHAERHIALIVAHLVYLSSLLDCDLPQAFMLKMQRNAVKYPVETASGYGYTGIKDQSRGR